MSTPRVSILMTTWNHSQFINKAIQSIVDQTFQDWELIIADDGSTDNTKKIVAEWQEKDNRIKYVNPGHQGRIAKISNFGLREARGQYVAILDDDDWWAVPEKLKKQVEFLDKNPDYVGCGGGMIAVDGGGKEISRFLKPEKNEEARKNALMANPIINSASMFRASAAREIGLYDESMLQFADWDFWLKIGLKGKLYNFREYFVAYRMWGGGSSFSKQQETSRSAVRIVKRYKNKYPGYWFALFAAYSYMAYANFPPGLRQFMNPLLSRLKKALFSR